MAAGSIFSMLNKAGFWHLACCWLLAVCGPSRLLAQGASQFYTGHRVALFDLQVLQVRGKSVRVKGRIANTGRLEVGAKKETDSPLVELDTFNLPALLWGHEIPLTTAVLRQIPRLKPGEISSPIWLDVTAVVPAPPPDGNGCPDLVIDTAFVLQYTSGEIRLRFHVKNIGNTPVEIAGKTVQTGVNVYFVSGLKLTRGAIPAGAVILQEGRESLTGWLSPGQKIQGEILVNLQNRTKFASNLLLELAPPPTLSECDRTNNTKSVALKY